MAGIGNASFSDGGDHQHQHQQSDSGSDAEVYPEGTDFGGGDVLISLQDLRDIKDLFDDHDDPEGMEIDDFIDKFGPVARRRNAGITDTDLALLFMRVDANANGSVDWGEISTYLLMTTEKEVIRQTANDNNRVFSKHPEEQDSAAIPEVKLLSHEHAIRRTIVPRRDERAAAAAAASSSRKQHHQPSASSSSSSQLPYITQDDFTVKMWQPGTLRHVRTPHCSRTAITDVVCTPQWHNTFGVASMDSTLSFYNNETGDMFRSFIGQRKSLFTNAQSGIGVTNAMEASRLRRAGGKQRRNLTHASLQSYKTIRRPVYAVGLNGADEKRLHFGDRHSVAGNVDTAVPLLQHFLQDQEIDATVLYDLGWDTRQGSGAATHRGNDSGPQYGVTTDVWGGFPTAFDLVSRPGYGSSPHLIVGLRGGGLQRYNLKSLVLDERGVPPVGIDCEGFYSGHSDWVSKMKYIPALDVLVTSSWDTTLHVRHLDRLQDPPIVLGRKPPGQPASAAVWNPLSTGHARRITTFDYHNDLKLIASCAAAEREALIWSPYITRPLGKLDSTKGHLLDLHFCQDDVHLVTLSDDNLIRLWDLRSYRCVTTLSVKKQAQQRGFTNDEKQPFQSVAFDERADAVVSAVRMPLTWPVQRNDMDTRGFDGHRRPVVSLTYAAYFGQLISVDTTCVIVWDIVSGDIVMRWELSATHGPHLTIVGATVDFHQRRLMVCLSDGQVINYNYVNAFELKTCRPAGAPDPVEEMAEQLLNEEENAARRDRMKHSMLAGKAPVVSVAAGSRNKKNAKQDGGAEQEVANAVCVAAQVKPRRIFAIVSTFESGTAAIHIDEDGGERQPQRLISTGAAAYCTCPLPNSLIAFGIHGGVSTYNLEEVGTKAQVFIAAPAVNSVEDPLMVSLFPGELEPDPGVVRDTNEMDRQDSFTDPSSPSAATAAPQQHPHTKTRRGSRRASVGFIQPAAAAAEVAKREVPAQLPGGGGGEEGDDVSTEQLERGQRRVHGITECIAPLHRNRKWEYVVTGHGDGTVRFWHVRQQRETYRFRAATVANDSVYTMTVNGAHTALVTGDHQGYISIFDVSRVGHEDWEDAPIEVLVFLTKRFRAHAGPVTSIVYVDIADKASSSRARSEDDSDPFSIDDPSASLNNSGDNHDDADSDQKQAGRVEMSRLRDLTRGKDALITTGGSHHVLLWDVDGAIVRSFGLAPGEPVGFTVPLEPSRPALEAMDMTRTNELYSFIEQYEGCSLQDVFDEVISAGHPFRADPDEQRTVVSLDDISPAAKDARSRFAAPSSSPQHRGFGDYDDTTTTTNNGGDASPGSDALSMGTTTAAASPDMNASPLLPPPSSSSPPAAAAGPSRRKSTRGNPPPLSPKSRESAAVAASLKVSNTGILRAHRAFDELQPSKAANDASQADAELPSGVLSARLAAQDQEALRNKLYQRLAAWADVQRRSFAKGTYGEPNVGRLIRRLLRQMIDGSRTTPPCILHHGHSFYIHTQDFANATAASGGDLNTSGVSASSPQQAKRSGRGRSQSIAEDTARFSQSMVAREVSGLANTRSSGFAAQSFAALGAASFRGIGGVKQGTTTTFSTDATDDTLTERFRAPRHTAAMQTATPRVAAAATGGDDSDWGPTGAAKSAAAEARRGRTAPPRLRLVGLQSNFVVTPGTAGTLQDAVNAMGQGVVRRPPDEAADLLHEDDPTPPRDDRPTEAEVLRRRCAATWDFLTELVKGREGHGPGSAASAPSASNVAASAAAAGTPLQFSARRRHVTETAKRAPKTVAPGTLDRPTKKDFDDAGAVPPAVDGFARAMYAGRLTSRDIATATGPKPSRVNVSMIPAPPSTAPAGAGAGVKSGATTAEASPITVNTGSPPRSSANLIELTLDDGDDGAFNQSTMTGSLNHPTTSVNTPGAATALSATMSPRFNQSLSRVPAQSNRRKLESKMRKKLEADAAGDDVVSRALRQALLDRDDALEELQETARRVMRQRGVDETAAAMLSSSVTQGSGSPSRRQSQIGPLTPGSVIPPPPGIVRAPAIAPTGAGCKLPPRPPGSKPTPTAVRRRQETAHDRQSMPPSLGVSTDGDIEHDLVMMPTAILAAYDAGVGSDDDDGDEAGGYGFDAPPPPQQKKPATAAAPNHGLRQSPLTQPSASACVRKVSTTLSSDGASSADGGAAGSLAQAQLLVDQLTDGLGGNGAGANANAARAGGPRGARSMRVAPRGGAGAAGVQFTARPRTPEFGRIDADERAQRDARRQARQQAEADAAANQHQQPGFPEGLFEATAGPSVRFHEDDEVVATFAAGSVDNKPSHNATPRLSSPAQSGVFGAALLSGRNSTSGGDDSDSLDGLDDDDTELSIAARRAVAARRRRKRQASTLARRGLTVAKARAVVALDPNSLARSAAAARRQSALGDDAQGRSQQHLLPEAAERPTDVADVFVNRLLKTLQAASAQSPQHQRRTPLPGEPPTSPSLQATAGSPEIRRIIANADTLRSELSANLAAYSNRRTAEANRAGRPDDDANSLVSDEERAAAHKAEQLEIQAAAAAREQREGGRHSTHDGVWIAQTYSRLSLKPLDDLAVLSGDASPHAWLRPHRPTTMQQAASAHGRNVGHGGSVGATGSKTARSSGRGVAGRELALKQVRQGAFTSDAAKTARR